ncbi:MAG: peptidase M29 [Hydrogenophaga sp.]|uniref:peptidase M29 n=1 Tax=Hydrogenophaga sp. TaxID=1904254 RepID=UPI0016A9F092|nr:peptidase M29 [Hydrogenophaga sp.]NIM39855.1 peptidase M29 [Hydrogenophaga sp.]NIN25051.1 peptidase M29 [Hydrogenophaga sp.]NIN29618.1 peptidase M29 [Hydrogenophaga sp.]NIN54090.1 peptidase M29 [Hydrogenophaga sp.]NIO50503.1 peptidase M29 [Hydrogenophaga sp.]
MLQERIEPAWIDAFEAMLKRCALQPGEVVAILGETQSRPVLVELAHLAAARLGARCFRLTLPSVFSNGAPVQRSTGASPAIQHLQPVIAALAGSQLVIDCTAEGLMHAPELPAILKGDGQTQPRVVYVSDEHPEALMRLLPDEATEARVKAHVKRLRGARRLRVTSAAGTDLSVDLKGAVLGGNWGSTTRPGTLTHWPGGMVLGFPAAGTVNGSLVLAEGDVNLTFKRYIERPITLRIESDTVTRIEGSGVDAELLRSHYAAWGEPEAYAVSHVGYGLNERARWDSMALYDKRDFNGTELRAFAGNFLYSTGANEVAGRHTRGHFDFPLRGCTVSLDDTVVIDAGKVVVE